MRKDIQYIIIITTFLGIKTMGFIETMQMPPMGGGLKLTALMFCKRSLNETDTRDQWNTHYYSNSIHTSDNIISYRRDNVGNFNLR